MSKHDKFCEFPPRLEIDVQVAMDRVPKLITEIPDLGFYPWIGKRYGENHRFDGRRLLILGESHYEW